jgi:hypothetical protein
MFVLGRINEAARDSLPLQKPPFIPSPLPPPRAKAAALFNVSLFISGLSAAAVNR